MYIPIIYQDEDIVVVNKPAGLPTHPDEESAGNFDVVSLVQRQLKQDYLGVHHRLDREVSGLLVFARRKEANAGLARSFEGRQVEKEYLAVVWGRPPQRAGVNNSPLIESGQGLWKVARPGEKGSKPATTRYRVEREIAGGYSLLRLGLETGRTHQLRLHLAQSGCPIVGDYIYGKNGVASLPARPQKTNNSGSSARALPAGDGFPRLLLHAARLAFTHPVTGKPLSFDADLPATFLKAHSGQMLPEIELAGSLRAASVSQLKPKDKAGLAGLLALAAERRAPLTDDPVQLTTAYRLVNGAGDALPGITLDRFGSTLILSCYDEALEQGHPALKLVVEEITRLWPDWSVYGRFRPRQLSNLYKTGAGSELREVAPELPLARQPRPEVNIVENGLSYVIKPAEGISPGLFLDMREVRARLANRVEGKTLLNCFSYTCAFGLVAAVNGAKRALNLDAGRKVLDWGKQNYLANNLTPDDYDFVEGDVFDWLNRFARREQRFDIVVLDPPSYSTVKKKRWSAEKNYAELTTLAAKVTAPGGLVLACTNLAGLSRRSFRQMAITGVEAAGRKAQVEAYYHEPALDFPTAGNSEGYLKVLVLKLD
ncbi:MAG TPA: pseudouridine synthase [Chloroflexia bacterium]|nr:pseudouridine synthase [Chloroflexia bacterium]